MKKLLQKTAELYTGRKKRVNAPRQIVLSFAAVILAGTILLMCPLSSKEGQCMPFLDALFTATSATCVTGLTVADTGAYFSFFGQLVIILLIQIGGLGFMTILSMTVMSTRKRMNVRSRVIAAQSLSVDSIGYAANTIGIVFRLTVIAEAAGALLLMLRFIPEFGLRGIWYGIFHSVSAFCNAGFDVFGTGDSICAYNGDPIIMLTISALIITGGLGFLVFEDICRKKHFRKFSLYSKLVIFVTVLLLAGGTAAFFALERNNPGTIGKMPALRQLLNAFFQSVTCRTAGFDSFGQAAMTEQSKLISVILMMIGGASGSTAGGIKVVTICVIFLAVISALRGKENVVVWGRRIRSGAVNSAMLLLALWVILVVGASVLVSFCDNLPLIDALYEVASAYGTVGLSVGVTGSSSVLVRLLLIVYMFFGRVGIITISVMFITRRRFEEKIKYPDGRVIIG